MTQRLELHFGYRRGQTRLTHVHADAVFKVTRPLRMPDGQGVQLTLMSPAPGIFGGDVWELHITAAAGSRVHVTTQGALRVHPSRSGEVAQQRWHVRVANEAALFVYSDPVIPFAQSRLTQQTQLVVEPSATLGWWEGFSAGRLAHAELWAFQELASETSLRCAEELSVLERSRVLPAEEDPRHPFRMGTHRCWATALLHAPALPKFPLFAETSADLLVGQNQLSPQLHLARFLASSGHVLRQGQQRWLAALSKLEAAPR